MPQRHAFFSNYFCCLINFDYLLCCFFFSFVAPKLSKWLFYAFYCNRFVSFSLEVIFIPVHQRMVKVRPTSPSFVLVWNTPEAYNGTHILKSIAKILKEYHGKPARFVKKKKCYEREPGTVKNLLCPVVRTPVSANHPGLNFNPSFFFFLSKALSPDNFLYSF